MPAPSLSLLLRAVATIAVVAERFVGVVDRLRGKRKPPETCAEPEPREYCRRYQTGADVDGALPCECKSPLSEGCTLVRAARRVRIGRGGR